MVLNNLKYRKGFPMTYNDFNRVLNGIDKDITNDILALGIRQSLHHHGEITGEITPDEIPSGMYGTFCLPATGRYWKVI